jgi:hypothetical protein
MDPQTGGRRTATFLPDVAAHEGWDKQQVRMRKASAEVINRVVALMSLSLTLHFTVAGVVTP